MCVSTLIDNKDHENDQASGVLAHYRQSIAQSQKGARRTASRDRKPQVYRSGFIRARIILLSNGFKPLKA
jgi:hypothetical protein